MDQFDSMWFMMSEYTMDDDFYVLSETVHIRDDQAAIDSAQTVFNQKYENPKYFHNYEMLPDAQ